MDRTFLVECYWPGVTEADLMGAARRAGGAARGLHRPDRPIRYLDALLVPDDEVAFCRFASDSADLVREASARAGLRHERVLEYITIHEEADSVRLPSGLAPPQLHLRPEAQPVGPSDTAGRAGPL